MKRPARDRASARESEVVGMSEEEGVGTYVHNERSSRNETLSDEGTEGKEKKERETQRQNEKVKREDERVQARVEYARVRRLVVDALTEREVVSPSEVVAIRGNDGEGTEGTTKEQRKETMESGEADTATREGAGVLVGRGSINVLSMDSCFFREMQMKEERERRRSQLIQIHMLEAATRDRRESQNDATSGAGSDDNGDWSAAMEAGPYDDDDDDDVDVGVASGMASSVIVVDKDAVLNEETKLLSPAKRRMSLHGSSGARGGRDDADDAGTADDDDDDEWEVLMMARVKCGLWQMELNDEQRMWIIEAPLDLERMYRNYYNDTVTGDTEATAMTPLGGGAEEKQQHRRPDGEGSKEGDEVQEHTESTTTCRRKQHEEESPRRQRYKHPKFVIESDDGTVYLVEVDGSSSPDDVHDLKLSLIKYVKYIETRTLGSSGRVGSNDDDTAADVSDNTANSVPILEDVLPFELAKSVVEAVEGRRKQSKIRLGESMANQITLGAEYLSSALVKGAEKAGYKIACRSRSLQRSTTANVNPVEVSDSMKHVMRVTRSTSEVGRGVAVGAAAITGTLATSIANSTAAVVSELCPMKGGSGLVGDVGAVIGATASGVAKLYLAVNEAAGVFCSQTAHATTEFVNHKYGADAAEVAADGFAAAGNLTSTARAMQAIGLHPQKLATMKVGPTGLAQATAGSFAKKTARAATMSTVQRLSDNVVLDDEIEQKIEDEENEFQQKLQSLDEYGYGSGSASPRPRVHTL